jgi:glycosyltransferase involved in cell wall biosynthesis
MFPHSARLRVLLIGNYPHDQQESMLRFAALILRGLCDKEIEAELLAPKPFFGQIKRSGRGLGKWLGYLDKFILFPIFLRRKLSALRVARVTPVVHICDHSNAMYAWFLTDVPHLVTVHDLLAVRSARGEFSQNPTGWSGRILQAMILSGLKKCRFAVADSTASRDDFLRLTGRKSDNVPVVPPTLNYPYGQREEAEVTRVLDSLFHRQQAQRPSQFFFHVGGGDWYKNRPGILRAFHQYRQSGVERQVSLVLAGALPDSDLKLLCAELRIESSVVWLGRVDNEELAALYNYAETLVFPSLAEGFGWPLLEAQACGCPVIASNRAPLTEVAGDGALYVNPVEPDAIATTLLEMETMPPKEREALRKRGFENVKRFTDKQMMDGYLEAYGQALQRAKQ